MKWLTDYEINRYKRQLMLTGYTLEHQQRLKNKTALIAGIGGIGGTSALYLSAAGIGKMIFVHHGNLTISNMNRQILMKNDWIGKSRVYQAKKTIHDFNPLVEVDVYDLRISNENIYEIIDGIDLVISARPNFEERRILNLACVKKGITMIDAAMYGMEGYLFNIIPNITPCFNCVYPEDNPEWKELGFPVLGAVAGLLGCLVSIEAIKILTGYSKPLISKMLIFETLNMEFTKVSINKNDRCQVCGEVEEKKSIF